MHLLNCNICAAHCAWVNLTKLWSPQLHLSGPLHVVIEECAHTSQQCSLIYPRLESMHIKYALG